MRRFRPLSKEVRRDPTMQKGNASRYNRDLNSALDSLERELVAVLVASQRPRTYTEKQKIVVEPLTEPEWNRLKNGFLEAGVTFREKSYKAATKYPEQSYESGKSYSGQQLKVSGIVPSPSINAPDQRAINALEKENLRLVQNMGVDTKKDVLETIKDDMEKGKGIEEMKRDISDRVDAVGRHRAELIARTETIRAFNEAAKQNYRQNGVGMVEWLTGFDDRTCDDCMALNGKKFLIDSAPDIPYHPQCRCTLLPVVDLESLRNPPKPDVWPEPETVEPEPETTPEPEPTPEPAPEPEAAPAKVYPDGTVTPARVAKFIDFEQKVDERQQKAANIVAGLAVEEGMVTTAEMLATGAQRPDSILVSFRLEPGKKGDYAGYYTPGTSMVTMNQYYYGSTKKAEQTEKGALLYEKFARESWQSSHRGQELPKKAFRYGAGDGNLVAIILHEVGHRITLDETKPVRVGSDYKMGERLWEAGEKDIAGQVSEYAMKSPIEYITEVWVMKCMGEEVRPEEQALWEKWLQRYNIDAKDMDDLAQKLRENPNFLELLEESDMS